MEYLRQVAREGRHVVSNPFDVGSSSFTAYDQWLWVREKLQECKSKTQHHMPEDWTAYQEDDLSISTRCVRLAIWLLLNGQSLVTTLFVKLIFTRRSVIMQFDEMVDRMRLLNILREEMEQRVTLAKEFAFDGPVLYQDIQVDSPILPAWIGGAYKSADEMKVLHLALDEKAKLIEKDLLTDSDELTIVSDWLRGPLAPNSDVELPDDCVIYSYITHAVKMLKLPISDLIPDHFVCKYCKSACHQTSDCIANTIDILTKSLRCICEHLQSDYTEEDKQLMEQLWSEPRPQVPAVIVQYPRMMAHKDELARLLTDHNTADHVAEVEVNPDQWFSYTDMRDIETDVEVQRMRSGVSYCRLIFDVRPMWPPTSCAPNKDGFALEWHHVRFTSVDDCLLLDDMNSLRVPGWTVVYKDQTTRQIQHCPDANRALEKSRAWKRLGGTPTSLADLIAETQVSNNLFPLTPVTRHSIAAARRKALVHFADYAYVMLKSVQPTSLFGAHQLGVHHATRSRQFYWTNEEITDLSVAYQRR